MTRSCAKVHTAQVCSAQIRTFQFHPAAHLHDGHLAEMHRVPKTNALLNKFEMLRVGH
jgi:hypothetical protein